jgi:hypothetical protein
MNGSWRGVFRLGRHTIFSVDPPNKIVITVNSVPIRPEYSVQVILNTWGEEPVDVYERLLHQADSLGCPSNITRRRKRLMDGYRLLASLLREWRNYKILEETE